MAAETALPKRRDAHRTRGAILAAAQQAFSAMGYTHAGVRDVATMAGVDAALVSRYFGSKQGLYAAALYQALTIDRLFETERHQFGAHLARLVAVEAAAVNPTAIAVLSSASPEAHSTTLGLYRERVIAPLAKWLGPPDAEQRAILITAICTGFSTFDKIIPLMSHAPRKRKVLIDWLAKALQEIVDMN